MKTSSSEVIEIKKGTFLVNQNGEKANLYSLMFTRVRSDVKYLQHLFFGLRDMYVLCVT